MADSQVPTHFRIAALQCNFEGGWDATRRVPALWHEFGFDTEQLYHPFANGYSMAFDVERDAGRLHDYLRECRAQGIGVILYLNCHILLGPDGERWKEWGQVARDGSPGMAYGTYHACCLNSTWTAQFLRLIAGLRPFDLLGVFFDGPTNSTCFCPACDSRFRASNGGSLSEADDATAAAFARESQVEFIEATYR